MKHHQSFRAFRIILLGLLYAGHGYGSDLKFVIPGSESKNLIPVQESGIAIVATTGVVSALNELLRANDKTERAYRRYFGVEPPGIFDDMRGKGKSGFLNYLFDTLSADGFPVSGVTLHVNNKGKFWKFSETGDYTSFAAIIGIQGSRYKSAILLIRVETLNSPETPGEKIISAKPGRFFVSLR